MCRVSCCLLLPVHSQAKAFGSMLVHLIFELTMLFSVLTLSEADLGVRLMRGRHLGLMGQAFAQNCLALSLVTCIYTQAISLPMCILSATAFQHKVRLSFVMQAVASHTSCAPECTASTARLQDALLSKSQAVNIR